MNPIAECLREVVESLATADWRQDSARLYSVGTASVAVIAEPEAFEWCDHYLAPVVASTPLEGSTMHAFVLRAIHDRSSWQEVQLAVTGTESTSSQTYSGTPIWEWRLGDGLYVQQYVARQAFTVIDVDRRRLTFVDDCESDPEWWMEPARLVREIVTRHMEGDSRFVLHAASVVLGDRGAAFVGPKRAGKTTLTVAALERVKAGYVANDRTYVEMEAGVPYIGGWPVTATLGIGTCLASPTLRSLLEGGAIGRYPQPTVESRLDLDEFRRRDLSAMMQERVKIELTPLEMGEAFGVSVIPRHRLDAVLFPKLDAACEAPELLDVSPSEAAKLLGAQVLTCDDVEYPDWLHLRRVSDAEAHRRVAALVEELVLAVPSYTLRFWDAPSASEMLRSLLSE